MPQRTLSPSTYRRRRARRAASRPEPVRPSGMVSRMRDSVWGDWVQSTRERARMSVRDLAAAARVGVATIYRWERGQQKPERPDLVEQVADALGVSHEDAFMAAGLHPAARRESPQVAADPLHPVAAELNRILLSVSEPDRQRLIHLVDALTQPYRRGPYGRVG
jgi:transcriptional regulator with XRE-family HTH domain